MFENLLADIDSLDGDAATKRRIVEMMLTQYAGARIQISGQAAKRRARDILLCQLRRAGYPARDQVRVIVSRIGVSRKTAWQWVRCADAAV